MCPLRFILIFFSAALAVFFASKTLCSSSHQPQEEDSTPQNIPTKSKQQFRFSKAVQNGFWVFIDMASGKYLWRNITQFNSGHNEERST
ncbi:hypothetical protein BUALT_Bualt16G0130200 [Buddleja alternifolia]|uniref:Uncharacterized protein n=1 Tax=Buddleja alternifolia TaxID=168488 RepID=A0AAV6W988_9LAMI|nr:hypothetical protein BUALT_Bualt16G0130200 [Buddleja alternifolia]